MDAAADYRAFSENRRVKNCHYAQLEPKETPIAVGLLPGQDNVRKSRVRNYLIYIIAPSYSFWKVSLFSCDPRPAILSVCYTRTFP